MTKFEELLAIRNQLVKLMTDEEAGLYPVLDHLQDLIDDLKDNWSTQVLVALSHHIVLVFCSSYAAVHLLIHSIMTALQYMDGRDTILSMFTKEELKEISQYGADQGVPGFTYYTETVEFFDEHEDEIEEYFDLNFGESIIKWAIDRGHKDMRSIKNFCTWAYLESIAHEFNLWLSP